MDNLPRLLNAPSSRYSISCQVLTLPLHHIFFMILSQFHQTTLTLTLTVISVPKPIGLLAVPPTKQPVDTYLHIKLFPALISPPLYLQISLNLLILLHALLPPFWSCLSRATAHWVPCLDTGIIKDEFVNEPAEWAEGCVLTSACCPGGCSIHWCGPLLRTESRDFPAWHSKPLSLIPMGQKNGHQQGGTLVLSFLGPIIYYVI